jgi:catechol 2,3-dioxygenase-like lactoylglutathione lyase family enzyme
MLGHLGINVPDLRAARRYYDALMTLVGFETFFDADDEFAYKPADNKRFRLEAVCHHDRDYAAPLSATLTCVRQIDITEEAPRHGFADE